MTKIRAFALHFPRPGKGMKLESFLESNFSKYCSSLMDVEREFKLDVFMNRVVLPPINELRSTVQGDLIYLSRELEEFLDDYGVDIAAIPVEGEYPYLKYVPKVLGGTEKIYFSFNVGEIKDHPSSVNLKIAVKTLREITKVAGQNGFTRIAFTYGSTPITPYFPATVSKKLGLSLSLLYASRLKEALRKGEEGLEREMERILREAYEVGVEVSRKMELEFLGVDSSISPWMEDSVARLIEAMIDNEFGSAGTYHAIFTLNHLIDQFSKEVKMTGFNEVMIPLAEDDGLKNAVRNKALNLKDLISYISVSVAGLDMVPIPSSVSDEEITKILRDAITIAHVKRRTIGVRIILAEAEAGGEINLEKFGRTPILPV